MDASELFKGFMNFGLAGMLFYMWYMQNRKETSLQDVIKDQIEEKRLMREDRNELVRTIREQSAMLGRVGDALQRVEHALTARSA